MDNPEIAEQAPPDVYACDVDTKLKRIIVRQGRTYDTAATELRASVARVTAGYLCKIANGAVPSLPLANAIVRWARGLGEDLTVRDLGVEVEL